MHTINLWWQTRPAERFWLGLTRHDGSQRVLAAPCGSGRTATSVSSALIQLVRSGDTIFHFDTARQAIVARSSATGRARKCTLVWTKPARFPGSSTSVAESMPSWSVGLDTTTTMEDTLSMPQIARLQSELFPALRDLEDAVGAPIHYPFAMGNVAETHLLAGQVFKLPALFVAACPTLARHGGRIAAEAR